ncbi:hypothetical protein [Delftia acidovorans]|uniref:hypothetical protein n=1 Tax=Delftia acidovorans TaxID=80866 RepID=UPI001143A44C|nr:hypothetical protein [Delftia acidovorans]
MPKQEESTTKVSYKNVGRWQELKPPTDWSDANRVIACGPLYEKEDIQALLENGCNGTRLFTAKCIVDTASDNLSLKDVVELLTVILKYGKYKNSQWCRQGEPKDKEAGAPKNIACAACDAYKVSVLVQGEGTKHYYAKFAISAKNNLLLIFSCHQ